MLHKVQKFIVVVSMVLGCFLFNTAQANSTQWKWIDATGQINYSDKPPPASVPKNKIISFPNGIEFQVASNSNSLRDNSSKTVVKQDEQNSATQSSQGEKEYQKHCNTLQNNLSKYKSKSRLMRINDKGNREIVSDDVRQSEMGKLENRIKEECSDIASNTANNMKK